MSVIVCPACGGEGRVYRMTAAYEAMATTAAGGTFGWTGETHEWRSCKPCQGTGLIREFSDGAGSTQPVETVP